MQIPYLVPRKLQFQNFLTKEKRERGLQVLEKEEVLKGRERALKPREGDWEEFLPERPRDASWRFFSSGSRLSNEK